MQFITVRNLRNSTGELWEALQRNEELVITNNGKPSAVLINIPDGRFEEVLRDIRQARLTRTLYDLREQADNSGFLSSEEIMAEINEARRDYQKTYGKPL
ncbi:MAG: type II toxin-antitoxin system prevent-host-death family antitoxin [Symbiobacteriaceae bacterium]|nr:type II toxin-antitoxin system prevent-host-death family antitoxin [Symbiobacteriaceae bacterium]